MKAPQQRSLCPISNALDIVGDKWTLLVIRDLFLGKAQYRELVDSPEGIPTNLLADRLKRLEAAGVLSKSPYQERPVRYRYVLTDKGRDLLPTLTAMAKWSEKYLPVMPVSAAVRARMEAGNTPAE